MIDLVKLALGVIVTCVGAYHCAKFLVAKHYQLKREKAQQKKTAEQVSAAMNYGAELKAHLTDPDLQAATVADVAKKVGGLLKAGKVKLAEQFEVQEEKTV